MAAATMTTATRLDHLVNEEADKLARGIDISPGPAHRSGGVPSPSYLQEHFNSQPHATHRPDEAAATASSSSRSSSRMSHQPLYDGGAQGIPVAAIGKVNVTDPWGTAWGMDSPYDASLAYASSNARIQSVARQSAYFGSNIGLAQLAAAQHSPGHVHPSLLANNAASPALSSAMSSASGSNGTYLWSEASSASSSSAFSSLNGAAIAASGGDSYSSGHSKRRSVSFQSELSNAGRRSPGALSVPEQHLRHSVTPPNLRGARSTTHLPSMLGNAPVNRRTTSTPGSEADRSAFRKSFIGGSVINQHEATSDLPPIPLDPKLSAKAARRASKHPHAPQNSSALASSRASIVSYATDRADATSISSTNDASSLKASKRKSWFSRSPSSQGHAISTESMNGKGKRRSSDSSRPILTLRKSSGPPLRPEDVPPPTPPIPDTLPLPPSLDERSRKASNASLRQGQFLRANSGQSSNPPSGSSSPCLTPEPVAVTGATPPTNAASLPTTPHSLRHKSHPTPNGSLYGTPLNSPSHVSIHSTGAGNNGASHAAPTTSSPLAMSPLTSPVHKSPGSGHQTSPSSASNPNMPHKPAASARAGIMQLSTPREHSNRPSSSGESVDDRSQPLSASEEGMRPRDHMRRLALEDDAVKPASLDRYDESVSASPSTLSGSREIPLAPAAVIRPSPSSPPALGLSALAEDLSSSHRSDLSSVAAFKQWPSAVTSSPLAVRTDSRPGTAPASSPSAGPRTSPNNPGRPSSAWKATSDQLGRPESPARWAQAASAPSSLAASRKPSVGSLRPAVQEAPPSPAPMSAAVEHVPHYLPTSQAPPRSASKALHQSQLQASAAAPSMSRDASHDSTNSARSTPPLLVPHQPNLNTSLSSFQVKPLQLQNAYPPGAAPMPRATSNTSLRAESFPLPPSPIPDEGAFGSPAPLLLPAEAAKQSRQPSPSPQGPIANGPMHGLKPRASSPNLRAADTGRRAPASASAVATQTSHVAPPPRKSSKSPFSLFKRSRSKTLGESTAGSGNATGQDRKMPVSAQVTPAPTPQLSFSSSTTSTLAGSEPSDQFYNDFTPGARPSFSPMTSVDGNAQHYNATLKKSLNQPLSSHGSSNSSTQNAKPSIKSHKSISRMFGASSKRNP